MPFPNDGSASTAFPSRSAIFAWDFARFEPILRAVANWQTLACILSEDDLIAYAPYDGGADLFLPDSSSRDIMKQRFAAYLSSRADGL